MSEWQPIESAPKDGTVFLALNHDCEVYVAKFTDEKSPRLAFRTHGLREQSCYLRHTVNGKEMLEPINKPWDETWDDSWTIWTRGYDFKPLMWLALTIPPTLKRSQNDQQNRTYEDAI